MILSVTVHLDYVHIHISYIYIWYTHLPHLLYFYFNIEGAVATSKLPCASVWLPLHQGHPLAWDGEEFSLQRAHSKSLSGHFPEIPLLHTARVVCFCFFPWFCFCLHMTHMIDCLVPLDFKGWRCWTCVVYGSQAIDAKLKPLNLTTCQPASIDRLSRQLRASFARFCLLLSTQNMPCSSYKLVFLWVLDFLKIFCLFQHKVDPVAVETRNKGQVLGLPLGQWSTLRGLRDLGTYQTYHMNYTSFHTVHWKITYSLLKKTSLGFEGSIFR